MILVGGTLGAGKSYVITQKFPELPQIDPDIYVEKLSGGNGKWNPKMGGKARALVQTEFKRFIKEGKSFVKQGVSANLNAVIAQNKIAKDAGFDTIFFYVDTTLELAQERANLRFRNGERKNEIPHYKIEKKLKDSKEVYLQLLKMDKFNQIILYWNAL